MNAPSLPSLPSELSADWLTSALGWPIADFSVEPIGVGTGFAGSVYRIHLTHGGPVASPDIPASIVWKTTSSHPSTHGLLSRLGIYGKEAYFYTKLAPQVSIAPRTYFSEFHPETGALAILQSDLSWMEAGDQIEGCSLAQANEVVRALAGLHARFWSGRKLDEMEDIPAFDNSANLFAQMHTKSWRQLSRSAVALPPGLVDAANQIAPHVVAIKSRLAAPPVTLLHGDVRSDNLFFGSGGLKLIDWQAMRTGRGAYDLAYFLATSLPSNVRRQNQKELIEAYSDALASHGVVGYDFDTCYEDLRWSLLDIVTFIGLIAAALDFGSGRGLQLANVVIARLWSSVVDNRALELLA